ncbi:MAG: membrane protein insertion efficiency factor YidD [Candidatus Sumerlaeia bacterium]|nr:membrane protein insertion efficiency factor YidD [Candidatus Sumerlaeia bacterium]
MKSFKLIDKTLCNALVYLVRFYQLALSPLLPPSCRFIPTCSHYALEALTSRSFPLAVWLILRRLLRCHPFSRGGFDPLPK